MPTLADSRRRAYGNEIRQGEPAHPVIGYDVQGLSGNADGTRLVLRKETFPSQIYIGALELAARRMRTPRRLTDDEAVDWATAWTPDSKAVLFTSGVAGNGAFSSRQSPTILPSH